MPGVPAFGCPGLMDLFGQDDGGSLQGCLLADSLGERGWDLSLVVLLPPSGAACPCSWEFTAFDLAVR